MNIKKFFAFSIIVHLTIFAAVYFIPAEKKEQIKEFAARLVTPDELKNPEIKTPPKKQRPLRPAPSPPKTLPRLPRIPKTSPPPMDRLRPAPSSEKPVVPGEGKETGRTLPEGMRPKEGEAGRGAAGKGDSDTRDTRNAVEQGKPGLSGREKLFDRGTIESVAKKDSGRNGSKAKKDDAVTFNTDDYRFAGYMRRLKEKIESIWEYPPEEASSGHYGDLKIRFTIKKDGRLGAVELERTSGYPALDKAAIKALKDGEPYWPLPDEWGMETYTVQGRFFYTMYGYQQIR